MQHWTLGSCTVALLNLSLTAIDRFSVLLIADSAENVVYHFVAEHEHVGDSVRIEAKHIFNAAVLGKGIIGDDGGVQ